MIEGRLMSEAQFLSFQRLVHDESGLFLNTSKKALLVGRLQRRLRALGCEGFHEYYELVRGDADERARMLECICTHETRFFREPRHFEFLEREVLPRLRAEADAGRRPRRLRAWSAACSSGEEPFSIAMSLRAFFPGDSGWQLEVVATDLSMRVLTQAREATWPLARSEQIEPGLLKRFMLRGFGPEDGKMRASAELRELVRFQQLNLSAPDWPLPGRFDLVFCRNVLIYFHADLKTAVMDRLFGFVNPGGYLFLGHSESYPQRRCVVPTVYRRPEEPR